MTIFVQMQVIRKIIDFVFFKSSFKIDTGLNRDSTKRILKKRFIQDISFITSEFVGYKFSFIHVSIFPKFYNYSPIIFNGEIQKIQQSSIMVSCKIFPIFFWIWIFGILSILTAYYLNLGGFYDKFSDTPFPIHPYFSPIVIIFPYLYYFNKLISLKRILKYLVKEEELRVSKVYNHPEPPRKPYEDHQTHPKQKNSYRGNGYI